MNGQKTPCTLKDWILLTRPWSVTAPLVPFLVGLGFAFGTLGIEPGGWFRWSLALVSAILLVLSCNLFNTWGDETSGVDRMPGAFLTTPQIQEGKITLRQTFIFGAVLFVLAGLVGLPTLLYATPDGGRLNWALLAGALVGFFGAVNYSTGVKYKYRGLGVVMVALLQGFLYVFVVLALLMPANMNYKLAYLFDAGRCPDCSPSASGLIAFFLLLALPVASLVGVILHGNDMRDIATDRAAGIHTLASRLGPKGALIVFYALHLLPYGVPLLALTLVTSTGEWRNGWAFVLPFCALPLTIRLLRHARRDYRANPRAPAWLDCEKGSGGVHFLFGLLYALALALV